MVRPHETLATSSLLRLIRSRGEAELGQTLIRLAQQAAAEHRARAGAQQDSAGPRDQAAALREMVARMDAQQRTAEDEEVRR